MALVARAMTSAKALTKVVARVERMVLHRTLSAPAGNKPKRMRSVFGVVLVLAAAPVARPQALNHAFLDHAALFQAARAASSAEGLMEMSNLLTAFTTEVAPPGASADDVLANLASMGLSEAPSLYSNQLPIEDDVEQDEGVQADDVCLPIVQMHGMGDFAKNPAYRRLGQAVSTALSGSSSGCPLVTPQLGQSALADIIGGFLRPLDASIDYFAEIIRNNSDIQAAGSFNAIGYSQGNLIIRGYIEKYNDPPVNHHMSMFGMGMGVAGFPGCNMQYDFCKSLDSLLGQFAYLPVVQNHLMQANYYRDPTHMDGYRAGNQGLAQLNNEADNQQDMYSLTGMTGNLTLVKGLQDTTVQPNDSEWYAYFSEGSQSDVVNMTDAEWYSWFGLDKMDAAGQLGFEWIDGKHMQFTTEELTDLVLKYW